MNTFIVVLVSSLVLTDVWGVCRLRSTAPGVRWFHQWNLFFTKRM
uniref:Putative secreted protein n=1 Tax=Ixodes scapularis TaxID=6945 RepID=Q4PN67_IXOSC|nr:putative secreted protein [Ixodes scapularis]